METKQTAVDWLIEQIIKYRLVPEGTNPDNVLFHKAKEMEKEQIELAHIDGGKNQRTAVKYYNKTFKSE